MSNVLTSPADTAPRTKGERTAARIREAALDLFSRLGFERVTMAGIAEAAEVSQPTLHYHFADKDQLWLSAMRDLGAVIAQEERLMRDARDATPLVKLRDAMRLFLAISWKHPALGRIVALEGMAGGERLNWLIDNLIGKRNQRLVNLARAAIAAGEVKDFPPEQIVILLQTGAVGAINLGPLMKANFNYDSGAPTARAAHEAMVVDALLGGLEIHNKRQEEHA